MSAVAAVSRAVQPSQLRTAITDPLLLLVLLLLILLLFPTGGGALDKGVVRRVLSM